MVEKHNFHFTLAYFWTHMVTLAAVAAGCDVTKGPIALADRMTFAAFTASKPFKKFGLGDARLYTTYFSDHVLFGAASQANVSMAFPDLIQLPNRL
jgi:hypothetical protein